MEDRLYPELDHGSLWKFHSLAAMILELFVHANVKKQRESREEHILVSIQGTASSYFEGLSKHVHARAHCERNRRVLVDAGKADCKDPLTNNKQQSQMTHKGSSPSGPTYAGGLVAELTGSQAGEKVAPQML